MLMEAGRAPDHCQGASSVVACGRNLSGRVTAGRASGAAVRWQLLVESARVRLQQMGALPPDKQRRRLAGWMARGGHDWDTTSAVLVDLGLK